MSPVKYLSAILLMAVSSPVFGTTIFADGSYHEFTFGVAPVVVIGCGPANAQTCTPTTNPVAEQDSVAPWTFTGPGSLFVLDMGHPGETFQVFDNGNSIGTTSATTATIGDVCGLDIACSIANVGPTGYSAGTFLLGGGSHSITIDLLTNPNIQNPTGGNDVFSLSAVPEPATFGLMGISLAGLAFLRRRRWLN